MGNNKKKTHNSVRNIRKELAILIKEKQSTCTTEAEKNKAVEVARQEINAKYGKGWRENYPSGYRQSYDEWWSDRNLDGSFAYNNASDDF